MTKYFLYGLDFFQSWTGKNAGPFEILFQQPADKSGCKSLCFLLLLFFSSHHSFESKQFVRAQVSPLTGIESIYGKEPDLDSDES